MNVLIAGDRKIHNTFIQNVSSFVSTRQEIPFDFREVWINCPTHKIMITSTSDCPNCDEENNLYLQPDED
ncbi:hypothetical protein Ngar_c27750 [Candidatus Nitrososphaera gargensis Ga9.2]|uniref:Uncharacterized protein n=1 Tax=Nitrososphaera gargensis (strain Ga9.2) TaxID=1237085 RepID=K0IEE0_NITGG|nr:hypothetical protein Ngar_c27750 [Candidatus Nitrososphaera gargensis Ga9.2]